MAGVYPIDAVSSRALLFILVMAALPVGLVWGAMKLASAQKAGAFSLVVLIIILPVFVGLFLQLFFVKAHVRAGTLAVGGGLYAIDIPLNSIHAGDIRVHSEASRPILGLRTNGIGMPGLSLGWFRAPGGRKVFAAVATDAPIVVIPTTRDFDIWVSPRDHLQFVEHLRAAAAQGH